MKNNCRIIEKHFYFLSDKFLIHRLTCILVNHSKIIPKLTRLITDFISFEFYK